MSRPKRADEPPQELREIRLLIPDAGSEAVRRRVADFSARLSPRAEEDAMRRIEAVSILDESPDDHEA